MRARLLTVSAVLTMSMFVACSHHRGIGQRIGSRNTAQPPGSVTDHFVPHISTDPANEGSEVKLFVRERRRTTSGPAVLFLHGRSSAALPAFDLDYEDYSWMLYLADAGF